MTINHFRSHCDLVVAMWLRPQNIHGHDHATICGSAPVLAHFRPILRRPIKENMILGFGESPLCGKVPLGRNTLRHCSWERRSFLEEEEEEENGRMRRGFHSNMFILSIYLCFYLFSWL